MAKQSGLTDIEIASAASMLPIQDVAGKLGIERGLFGEFVNLLSIKLKQCQFGCF